MKQLTWLVDSLANLRTFPPPVQDDIGYDLYLAQLGDTSYRAKPLRGLGSGVMESYRMTQQELIARSTQFQLETRFMLCMRFRKSLKAGSQLQNLKSMSSSDGLNN